MIEQFHMLLNKNKRQMDFLPMPLQKLTGAGKTCQKATKFWLLKMNCRQNYKPLPSKHNYLVERPAVERSVPLKSTAFHPSTLNYFTTSVMNKLWYVSSALEKPEWHTCEYKTKDFAFLYSRMARSYSPLAMFARIMLGRLKRVLKRWSIPCTDLIRSAWACHHTYTAQQWEHYLDCNNYRTHMSTKFDDHDNAFSIGKRPNKLLNQPNRWPISQKKYY